MWLSEKPFGLRCSPLCPVRALTIQPHSASRSHRPKGAHGKTSTAADSVAELTMSPSSQLLNSSPFYELGDFFVLERKTMFLYHHLIGLNFEEGKA